MKKNSQTWATLLLASTVAGLLASAETRVQAGLLETQCNPVAFGNVYWGNPTNWDMLQIPHYQLDTPGDGTHQRDINFISIVHDDFYYYVRVNFLQAPPFDGSEFFFWMDTDLNPNTGSRDYSGNGAIGSEYLISGAAVFRGAVGGTFVNYCNWDSYPQNVSGVAARDVIFSLDRTFEVPGVTNFYFTYQLYNSTDGVTGDWYPDSADTQNGDYFEYTTTPLPAPVAATSAQSYSNVIAKAAPLAYFRLNETNPVVTDVATNSGSIGADGNGVYTTGALHPVPGPIIGDSATATRFSAVNADSDDGAVPVLVSWPEKPLIRELWDGVAPGPLDKAGDGTTSVGFAPSSVWHVNNGRIMKVSPYLDINSVPGPPYNRGKAGALYADDSDIGGLSDVWDTSAWATRLLASSSQINFGSNGDYWITVRVDNGGDTAMGVGFSDAGDGSGHVVGVGATWNTAGGGNADNSVYVTDGNLGTDSPYNLSAYSFPGFQDGPGLIVAHLVTTNGGLDSLQVTALHNADTLPTDPSTISWEVNYNFTNTMTAAYLVTWLNGDTSVGNGQLDAIRVTTNFADMFQGEINPAGSFSVEAWLRPTTNGNGNAQSPLQNKDPLDILPNRVGWDFFQRDATVGYNFRMFNGNTHDQVFDITGGPYTVGQWGHLVAVYDAVAGSATLYFDGQQVAQSTVPNGTFIPNGTFPLSIGGYADASQNPFIGDMAEVALYTNALSAAQVLAHYQNATNPARSVAYSTLITSDGPVEYLRLSDPAQNIAADIGTLGTNAVGIYNPYMQIGASGPRGPADAGFEAANGAAAFNGGNTYIELGNPSALNFTGPITLEAWVQPSVTPATAGGFGDIIAHGYDEDNDELALRVDNSSGTPQYSIATYTPSGGAGVSVPVPAADLGSGAWVHLVGTFDGSNWNLYRNGVLLGSSADTVGAVQVFHGNWAIGARGRWAHMDELTPTLDRQFQGAIDEPAIYDRALSPSEVLAHYLVGSANGPTLNISVQTSQGILTWPVGTLQQSTSVTGPYTDVPAATSPYTNSVSGSMFYRLRL